jgi:hypothetical protein
MRALPILACLLTVSGIPAQSVILPSAIVNGPRLSITANMPLPTVLATPASHVQLIYDANDVRVPFATWSSLQVRNNGYAANAQPALTGTGVITMALSSATYSAVSTTFATNLQIVPTTVWSGPVALAATPFLNAPAWPAPWQAPWAFSTPFTFVQALGKSLVIDIAITGTAAADWSPEQWSPELGMFWPGAVSSTCPFSNGAIANGVANANMATVGQPWNGGYAGYPKALPPGLPGVGAIGVQGPGGTWMGKSLPIDMTQYGAPGCTWSVSADLTVPLSIGSNGLALWPQLMVPNLPSLAYLIFYDQALFLDPLANGLGAVSTGGSKWIVGPGLGGPGATLLARTNQATATTGQLNLQWLTAVKLN